MSASVPPKAGVRVRRRRLALLGIGVVVALPALLWAASSVRAWLADQASYQCSFAAIELHPPPPDELTIDAPTLLEQARRAADWPEQVSILSVDLGALRDVLRLHAPWLAKVERVSVTHPNRIVAEVTYRQAVAFVPDPPGPGYVLDGRGVLLPTDELRPEARARLIRIAINNTSTNDDPFLTIAPPTDPRPGRSWVRAGLSGLVPVEDQRVLDAAALAEFLSRRRAQEKGGDEPTHWAADLAINPTPTAGLFVTIRFRIWAFWGEAVGAESSGFPTAAEKWDQLRNWALAHPKTPTPTLSTLVLNLMRRKEFPIASGSDRESSPSPPAPPPGRPDR